MLTGRHPHENEVWTNDHSLGAGAPTFAHSLGAAGYRPALIGRMHAIGPDQLQGFAERLVGDHGPNYLGGGGVGHGMLNGTAGPARVSLELSGHGQSAYEVHDEAVTAAAVGYLNEGRRPPAGGSGGGAVLPHGRANDAPSAVCGPTSGLRSLPRGDDDAGVPGAVLRIAAPLPALVAGALRHRRGVGRGDTAGADRLLGARHAVGCHDRRDSDGAARERFGR